MEKDNSIHASIHHSDRDIGKEKEKDNSIHTSIHHSDRDIGKEKEKVSKLSDKIKKVLKPKS
jgi:hypothetical protein